MTGLCMNTSHAVAAFTGVPITRERYGVVDDVLRERHAQDVKWGVQSHPDGTGPQYAGHAEGARTECDREHRAGHGTWRHILMEEVWEAMAEDDPQRLRAELVQVAAVATAWVEAIDRRADQ